MNHHLKSIFLKISFFSVSPVLVFLQGLIDPMVKYQYQDHGLYLSLSWIHLHFKQYNITLALTGGLSLLGLSTNIVLTNFCYVAVFAIKRTRVYSFELFTALTLLKDHYFLPARPSSGHHCICRIKRRECFSKKLKKGFFSLILFSFSMHKHGSICKYDSRPLGWSLRIFKAWGLVAQ